MVPAPEKRFIREYPCARYGREESPAVVGREFGRAVDTETCFDEIAVIVPVSKPSDEGSPLVEIFIADQLAVGCRPDYFGIFSCHIVVGARHITIAVVLVVDNEHGAEIVLLIERIGVVDTTFEKFIVDKLVSLRKRDFCRRIGRQRVFRNFSRRIVIEIEGFGTAESGIYRVVVVDRCFEVDRHAFQERKFVVECSRYRVEVRFVTDISAQSFDGK